MPITEELKNVKTFESVGFTHEQSEALAESLEQAQTSGNESLKEFIRNELKFQIGGLRHEFDNKFNEFRYDLLLKIFAIVTGTAGLLFVAIKLFT